MSKCVAVKENGQRCRAGAMKGSKFCHYHDPKTVLSAKAISSLGGRNYHLLPGESTFNWLCNVHIKHAQKRGIKTELTKGDLFNLFTGDCYYCGEKPKQKINLVRRHGEFLYNGIDRIDNSKGYVIGNVVSCCGTCNKAKQSMNLEEFYTWIVKVYNFWIKNQ